MKASEVSLTFAALIVAAFCLIAQFVCLPKSCPLLCDINLRHAEVSCSHEGVNPFHVWTREVVSPRYKGLPRPDFPRDDSPGKRNVHAYPPWHTTFCWAYGWLPTSVCAALVSLLSAIGLAIGICWVWRRTRREARPVTFAVLCALAILPASSAFWTGNYGLVILGLFLVFLWGLERGHAVLAGVCWALMMIKPQIALLFFWPLLFRRRFTTIAVAVLLCVLGTLWPMVVYHESPIALLLQIPEIGKPYVQSGSGSFPGMANMLLGQYGGLVWSGVCFIGCGVFSFFARTAPTWLLRFVPALIVFPIWTYSQLHDLVVQLPFYVLLTLVAFGYASIQTPRWEQRLALGALWASVCGMAFDRAWMLLIELGCFDPTGRGWIYRLVTYSILALTSCAVLALALFARRADDEASAPTTSRIGG